VPIVQEAGWAAGPVWTRAKNLAPTGIRSPDRPAHSQSLYRLSYPAHNTNPVHNIIYNKIQRISVKNFFYMFHQSWSATEENLYILEGMETLHIRSAHTYAKLYLFGLCRPIVPLCNGT
jgi:hypothetical protein